ncbi:uncharacterized protein ATNIH1004_001687 [Aspergillus tanneri]|uniref:Uncharacterized protein n=1 Tax=Aspergillus tanneri TaxID=1220188 RepID=A0A5M9N0C2_9EURO|nr:uncharacterized protein ATNIH1004_001687 [Aspergillus tanneri]KAA8652782.1 hypothetical protein ATNIH1004_001687 [Aspergillus tanneri]
MAALTDSPASIQLPEELTRSTQQDTSPPRRRINDALAPVTTLEQRTRRKRVITTIYIVFIPAVLLTTVLTLLVLTSTSVEETGIATINLNWQKLPETDRRVILHHVNLSQSIRGGIETAIFTTPSAIETAAKKVEFNQSLDDDLFPYRISLGTQKLCTKIHKKPNECHQLPVNVSNILPKSIQTKFEDAVESFQSLGEPASSQGAITPLITIGLVLALTALLTPLIIARWPWPCYRRVKQTVMLTASLACLVCFSVSAGIIYALQSALQTRVTGISFVQDVSLGPAGRLSLGATCCAVIIMGCSLAVKTL